MKYNIVIKTEYLEKLNELISHDSIFYKKRNYTEKTRNKNGKTIIVRRNANVFNQICTCIIRIRETVDYLNDFDFKKDNKHNQAFDFYEFINLISIVLECIDTLFVCFGLRLKKYYAKKCFIKSNITRKDDITFFKFIRSGSSVHPNETTNYRNITKVVHEYYPYAIWNINSSLFLWKNDMPKDFDVALTSWNSSVKCFNKYYCLYIKEFYDFLSEILDSIKNLIPIVESIIDKNKEKRRCKSLKKYTEFKNRTEYCKYLRMRLKRRKRPNEEFADGGLLLASHILLNNILSDDFKNYIFNNVKQLAKQMLIDIDEISFNDIYSALYLGKINNNFGYNEFHYVCEKFDSYLEKEAKIEIENNKFIDYKSSLRYESNNMNYSNAEWATNLLFQLKDFYTQEDLEKIVSFTDLYEITLQRIWYYLNKQKEGE